jgi:hypothetical protein
VTSRWMSFKKTAEVLPRWASPFCCGSPSPSRRGAVRFHRRSRSSQQPHPPEQTLVILNGRALSKGGVRIGSSVDEHPLRGHQRVKMRDAKRLLFDRWWRGG